MEVAERAVFHPEQLKRGTKVGSYEILELVGAGTFGLLYKVERAGRTYALKLSRNRLGDMGPEDREFEEGRANREVAALRSLRHPNIVRTHANDQWPEPEVGFPYLVMDFVEGTRLYDWRRRTGPTLKRICITFEKIALAVDHMHGLGLYHRDLKSDNILVRASDGEPIIVDFGTARPRTAYRVTRAQTAIGPSAQYSPEYVTYLDSAECLRGEPFEWKATTDLYSIGFLLYETLVLTPPLPMAKGVHREAELFRTIKLEKPNPPFERTNGLVPPSLDRIVLKLLEKDPASRYQSGREVAEALAAAREAGDASWDVALDGPAMPLQSPALPGPPATDLTAEDEEPDEEGGAATSVAPVFPAPPPSAPHHADAKPVDEAPDPSFQLPTVDSPPPFEPVTPPDAPSAPTDEPPQVPVEVRQGQELLARCEPRRKPPYLILGGVGIVALMLLFFLFAASRAPKQGKPENLLAAEREQEKREQAIALGALQPPPPGPAQPGATLPPPLASEAPKGGGDRKSLAGAGRDEPVPKPLPSRPTARGKRRSEPRVAPSLGDAVAKEPSESTEPLLRSARPAPVPDAKASRGIPMGSRIPARLITSLDSRTIADGPVEAVIPAPFVRHGDVLLPARTVLFGRAATSAANGRFTVHFTRMRLPDDTEIEFSGIAFDRNDGKPGLAAARRIDGPAFQGESLAGRVAKGAGNVLLNTVSGGVVQDAARTAGQAVMNEQGASPAASSNSVILLDGGALLEVWVEAGF